MKVLIIITEIDNLLIVFIGLSYELNIYQDLEVNFTSFARPSNNISLMQLNLIASHLAFKLSSRNFLDNTHYS